MRDVMYDTLYETEAVHWWYRVRRVLIASLVGTLQKPDGRALRILYIGCGTGLLMKELSAHGEVTGVDMSERAAAYCKARGLSVDVASAEKLPYADGAFDAVIILDVLEHLADDRTGVKEVARVLTPGGTAIVTVPAFTFLWGVTDELSQHYRRYARGAVVRRLEECGLTVQRATYFNTFLFLPIAAVRLAVRFLHIPMESENRVGGPTVNRLLHAIFSVEVPMLRWANFPFGVSVLVVARKPVV
jgi:SAM-dependent methyltransferase